MVWVCDFEKAMISFGWTINYHALLEKLLFLNFSFEFGLLQPNDKVIHCIFFFVFNFFLLFFCLLPFLFLAVMIDSPAKFRLFAWPWVSGIGLWKGVFDPFSIDIKDFSSFSVNDLIFCSKGETVFVIMVVWIDFIPLTEIDNDFG